jgi:hypothetical protein
MEFNCKIIPWVQCDMEYIMKSIKSKQDVLWKIILFIKGLRSCVMTYKE